MKNQFSQDFRLMNHAHMNEVILFITKFGMLCCLLIGVVSINATNPLTKTKAIEQKQTEAVPTVHNQKLDKALRKYIETSEDREYIEGIINKTYKDNGTYAASALMQHEINLQQLCSFMSGNTDILIKNNINPELGRMIKDFGVAFYKTVTPREEKVVNWLMNSYNVQLLKDLQFDHKPTAAEVCIRLDNIAKSKAGFTRDELIEYYALNDEFIYKKLKKRNDTQAMSDLIAYKMYLIDKIIFEKELDGINVFDAIGRFENSHYNILYYYRQWIKSVEPTAN